MFKSNIETYSLCIRDGVFSIVRSSSLNKKLFLRGITLFLDLSNPSVVRSLYFSPLELDLITPDTFFTKDSTIDSYFS